MKPNFTTSITFILLLLVASTVLGNTNNTIGNKATAITLNKKIIAIPVDLKATKETKMLFNNMMQLGKSKNVLFGHQDDLAYGSSWRYNTANKGNLHVSDTKDVVGDLPALFGWDLGQYYTDSLNYLINGVLIHDLKKFMISAYQNGGINTLQTATETLFMPYLLILL